MRRIKLTVSYDGTNYCGWQIQPNGITIEEVLNKAICKLTGEEIAVIGASRTDSGVHALGNVAVFDTESRIPAERFSYALNQRLPHDIVVVKSEEVPADWHPRYQDTLKTYEYHIINTKTPIPIKRLYNYFVSFDLDVEKMRKGAEYLLGEHDFAAFCCIRTNVKSTVRTITDLQIIQDGEEITIRITGNGFLYNMVRIIAGVLVRVGRGFYEPEKVKELLEGAERTKEAVTAPPQGLCLMEIKYGNEKKQFDFRMAEEKDLPTIMNLMEEAKAGVPDTEWFEADDIEFAGKHINEEGFTLLAEHEGRTAAFMLVRIPGTAEDNLGEYLNLGAEEMQLVAHLESAVVSPEFQGNGLQYRLACMAEEMVRERKMKYLMVTVHPDNSFSLNNVKKLGMECAADVKKYGGMRRYVMWKEI